MDSATETHVFVGFENPFLVCETCKDHVSYWHDPNRCHCGEKAFNYPCKHQLGVISICTTWHPGKACSCKVPCTR
jgi:hypothetical protein